MSDLRKKAEELVDSINLSELNLEHKDKLSIIYELLVHQRELEIQNEEIRRANLELEELKNKYYDLYNSAPVGYLTLNEVGIILSYNQTFSTMLKIVGNDIKGKSLIDFVHSNDHRYFLANYKDFYTQPEGKNMELRFIRGKGYLSCLVTGKRDKYSNNLNIIVTDISEIKESQRKIDTYMKIIDLAPVSIVITDRNNNVIFVNDFYCNVTGYSKHEIIGRNPGFIKSGKTPLDTYKSLWATLSKKMTWEGSFINRKKNGELFTEEAKITPILDERGNIIYYVAIKNDVTEKILLQEKEKSIAKAKSLINISGGIAHHLNNINTPILIIAQELSNNLKDKPEYLEKLQIIQKSVLRATNIINSIMKFSRNAIMTPKKVNLMPLLNIALGYSKHILTDNIKLIMETDPDINYYVKADLDMISQAIFNVIKNAKEAMPTGGDIYVRLFVKDIQRNDICGKFAVIQIEDTGVGIPDHIKPNVFEPFFTTKFMHTSPGLGLSEVLGIMEQHGGFVELESKVNEGTIVELYLPIVE
ncbi:MAG: PAS domain S-box protein [Calditerrivibrio sp.]|nr:PAS domain S-box protein [Calditerrivibrio sp.]